MAHCLLLAALCAGPAGCGGGFEAGGTVREFIERANGHRVEYALAMLGDDVAVEFPDSPPLRGRDAVRDWLVWDSVVGAHWTLPRAMRQTGDTVWIDGLTERNHWLLVLGLPGLARGEGTRFVVGPDGIRTIRLAPLEPASRRLRDERLADVLAWARHEYPERLGRIRRGDAFIFQGRTATDWLSLVREWRTGRR